MQLENFELEKDYSQVKEIPQSGFYSNDEYLWLIDKCENWSLNIEQGFLKFGNAGCDGVAFGLRKGMLGIWAFYPIEFEYVKKADTIAEFVEGWLNGNISV